MNDLPELEPGGKSPVMAYFNASIMVVLPQPFGPRINDSGLGK